MPVRAIPAAIENRFCSAIPMLKKRFGNASMNGITSVYFDKSAERATTSGLRLPSAISALPNGASVMFRGESSYALLFTGHLALLLRTLSRISPNHRARFGRSAPFRASPSLEDHFREWYAARWRAAPPQPRGPNARRRRSRRDRYR